jgi:uncharacterized membrane protein YcaP (DUF421 family)
MMDIDLLGLERDDLLWYQMFTRALIVFIVAMIFIRVAGMRSFGTSSAFDIVLSITLGGILSRCITGHYPFFATLGTAFMLALLHRITAWLSYKNAVFNKYVGGKVDLIYDQGKFIRNNLAKHCIAESELHEFLRQHSLEDFSHVKKMYVEPNGKVSIIPLQK